MPIKVKQNLPARDILENENIFVMTDTRAMTQDIRPLKVLVLNLMPTKIVTETQILRKLSNTPLQIEVEFLQTVTYQSQHTDESHLNEFYKTFDDVKDDYYDGLVITGAPLDFVDYEDVDYWDEICEIMEWSKKHVHCTFHLCWGAFAGLYYHYGIRKRDRIPKLSGIYEHKLLNKKSPLFRGFDDVFYAPHSRHTGVNHDEIAACEDITVLAESEEAGELILVSHDGKKIFVLGHLEYDRMTLDSEYKRDKAKGLDIEVPENYYPDDDSEQRPKLRWRGAANALFSNWLNYYVYQNTPYSWD